MKKQKKPVPPAEAEPVIKKQPLLKRLLFGPERPDLSELEAGSTTILDILSPTAIDTKSRDYIVVDGVFHAYLYIAGYGYSTTVGSCWLAPLVEAGEGVNVSFSFTRQNREKILSKIAQTTMLNRSRMRDVGDTRQDYEELDSAITSGLYLKDVMNRQGEDFYYMHTLIEVVADDPDTLEQRVTAVEKLCVSVDMIARRCDYANEQGFLSKVICLIPGNDGHIYEMHKTEQGEFIAPKHKIIDFQAVAAGFTPALPLIPLSLMRQIIAFFRSFMAEHGQEYEALVLIYWDKWKEEYLAYVPKQNVSKAGIHASLQENPYDDESRYIHYADIHSHNSMEAFFSSIDDADERGTGIYMVLGHLDHFYPEIAARICCGGSFVDIDPGTVVEGLEEPFPPEWCTEVSHEKVPVSRVSPRKAEKTGIWGWKALDLLLGDLK